ncbi:MAG TPA: biotin attachment protein [Acidimicrobiales bacterium]|nr:biotin attachment protein [Acidimicrobiales bacterium]
MTEIPFPLASEDDPGAEGVVGTWFVDHGAPVAEGQLIAEAQLDKVSEEVHAPVAGILYHYVAEGVGVAQGSMIGRIDS